MKKYLILLFLFIINIVSFSQEPIITKIVSKNNFSFYDSRGYRILEVLYYSEGDKENKNSKIYYIITKENINSRNKSNKKYRRKRKKKLIKRYKKIAR